MKRKNIMRINNEILELERRRRSENTLPAKTTHLSRQKCQVEDSKYFPPKIKFVCPLTAEQNPTHVTANLATDEPQPTDSG